VYLLFGAVLIAQGHMSQGLKMIQEIKINCIKNQRRTTYALSEYFLGKIYLQMVERSGPKSITFLAKNLVFLIKNVPLAGKKAEEHFEKALEVSKEIGAKGYIAMVSLDLGILHKANKRPDKARRCISEAIKILEECEAEGYLKQAKRVFESLG
jgi:tetratricopeptide (TPR) repeat protein